MLYFSLLLKTDEDCCASALIRNGQLEIWNKTTEELLPIATENTNRMQKFFVKGMSEIMAEMMGEIPDLEDETPDFFGEEMMYVLTDESKMFGASQLFLKDSIRKFAAANECDVIILPSSTHELILMKADFPGISASSLSEMVRQVNTEGVSQEDFLSDNVYFYDLISDEITMMN